MRLWTYQPRAVVDTMESEGVVGVDPRYYEDGGHVSYRWLAARLHRVIAGYSGRFPWWLYTQRPLPECGRSGELLLEFEIPGERCFEMPTWAWNAVFCGQYLAFRRRDFERWKRRCRRFGLQDPPGYPGMSGDPEPPVLTEQVMASFERLFDPSLPKYPPRHPRGWNVNRTRYRPKGRGRRPPRTEVVTEWLRPEWRVEPRTG